MRNVNSGPGSGDAFSLVFALVADFYGSETSDCEKLTQSVTLKDENLCFMHDCIVRCFFIPGHDSGDST